MAKQKILIVIVLLVFVGGLGSVIYAYRGNLAPQMGYVSPIPAGMPVPEFPPASNNPVFPAPAPVFVAVGYIAGHVTIGPNCPVERIDQPCEPSPQAYMSREAVVYGSDGRTEKARTHLDGRGNYQITLRPGNYFVQIQPAGIRAGEKKPAAVKGGKTTRVDFNIDTGIR